MTAEPGAARWADALRVAALLAADPHGCGGVRLRAGAGPVRDAWLGRLAENLLPGTPVRRCPAGISDDRLLGGLDLAATLAAGRPVAQAGLLAEADGGLVLVAMAERLSPGTAARLAASLDTGRVTVEREGFAESRPARFGLVLLDEGLDDEAPPIALTERLAFDVDLWSLGLHDLGGTARRALSSAGGERCDGRDRSGDDGPASSAAGVVRPGRHRPAETPVPARERMGEAMGGRMPGPGAGTDRPGAIAGGGGADAGTVAASAGVDAVAALCATADALGIAALRGPLLALRVARLIAAGAGHASPDAADTVEAARLVLAPRATRLPAAEVPNDATEPPPQDASADDEAPPDGSEGPDAAPEARDGDAQTLDDVVLAAALAAIPPGLLAALAAVPAPPRGGKAGKAGAAAAASRQGRPIGARAGDPRRGRLALLATLRAAAPWQGLRRAEQGEARTSTRIVVRPEDFRITRYRQRTESTTIFAVDASGSAALERLAEAKGAVELLLAEAYVRRDRVALVAFRGRAAELVLPPTRSLVRAKRGLAGLPGGGGTPLAAGLDAAGEVALGVRRGGGTPVVVLLTDGRANIDRSGASGRTRAAEDALSAARRFRAAGVSAILIDTAPRPQDSARALAVAMGARYLPLPQADAARLSAAVRAA